MTRIEQLSKALLLLCGLSNIGNSFAQLPECNDTGKIIYFHGNHAQSSESYIYNYNTQEPISATNPKLNTIPPIANSGSLAVSPNITTADPAITFYTIGFNDIGMINYQYYDASSNTWVNTGHRASGVNIGAGGGYIYNTSGGSLGYVYRYDGTQGDVRVIMAGNGHGSILLDIIADNEGNFYLLSTSRTNPLAEWMRKYNSEGVLLQEWKLAGVAGVEPAGGFAIIDNTVYFDAHVQSKTGLFLYKGVVCADTIHFSMMDTLFSVATNNGLGYGDFASCPKPLYSYIKDTICYTKGIPLNIKSSGVGPYTYTILEGSAQISGSGPEFMVSPNSLSATVLLHATNYCNTLLTDTFTFISYPMLDAGSDFTIFGCADFTDTLHASLRDTMVEHNYTLEWSPMAFITSGETTLNPVIQPTGNTTFTLKVTTPQCGVIEDSVRVSLKDKSVTAAFSFDYNYGCVSDTVTFINNSIENDYNSWRFGDNNTDTIAHPVHIYSKQDSYKVTLIAWNDWCSDSIILDIDTRHPLNTSFITEEDTICQGGTVKFTNTSEVTLLPAYYHWDFGDGNKDSSIHAEHIYERPGIYKVQLVITDDISCSDTFFATVVVDSLPDLSLNIASKELCVGQAFTFDGTYTLAGNTGIEWDFGDAGFIPNIHQDGYARVSHAYDRAGAYPVLFSAQYRACKDTFATDTVYVNALPLVNLGPDTVLCFDGAPIILKNHEENQPGYHHLWSTGDTTANITVGYPGEYSLVVTNQQGCVGTESITIKKDCYIDIPNAFSPNGDGANDYFFPRQLLSKNITQFRMQILNRWGQVLFETNNIHGRGWDGNFNGKEQPAGVYIYVIDAQINYSESEVYKGNLTLLR